MSHLSNQSLRSLVFGLSILSSSLSLFAQSGAISDKKPNEPAACEPSATPIKRVKKSPTLTKAAAVDWTTMASTYSHDLSGQRVDQYALPVEPQSNERSDFVRSGYRHTRSTLQAGFSSDNYHVTESWGQPVRPYGEWRYPNRPFSVPYGQWGPQLPQVVVGGNQFSAIGPWGMNPNMPPNTPGNNAMNNNAFNNAGINANAANGGFANGQAAGVVQPGQGQWTPGPWGMRPVPGFGYGPGTGYGPGMGYGGYGNGMGQAFGVGPQNALRPGQDEYYPQSPTYHPLPEEGFQSPFRN